MSHNLVPNHSAALNLSLVFSTFHLLFFSRLFQIIFHFITLSSFHEAYHEKNFQFNEGFKTRVKKICVVQKWDNLIYRAFQILVFYLNSMNHDFRASLEAMNKALIISSFCENSSFWRELFSFAGFELHYCVCTSLSGISIGFTLSPMLGKLQLQKLLFLHF